MRIELESPPANPIDVSGETDEVVIWIKDNAEWGDNETHDLILTGIEKDLASLGINVPCRVNLDLKHLQSLVTLGLHQCTSEFPLVLPNGMLQHVSLFDCEFDSLEMNNKEQLNHLKLSNTIVHEEIHLPDEIKYLELNCWKSGRNKLKFSKPSKVQHLSMAGEIDQVYCADFLLKYFSLITSSTVEFSNVKIAGSLEFQSEIVHLRMCEFSEGVELSGNIEYLEYWGGGLSACARNLHAKRIFVNNVSISEREYLSQKSENKSGDNEFFDFNSG